jgi:hypothetical protein
VVQGSQRVVSIECAPGFFAVPAPRALTLPHCVRTIDVPAGGSTDPGQIIQIRESTDEACFIKLLVPSWYQEPCS